MKFTLLLLSLLTAWLLAVEPTTEKFSYVAITQPGQGAEVLAPIVAQARLNGDAGRWLRLELFGNDERLLSRRLMELADVSGYPGSLALELDYEVRQPAERGWLRLVILDEHLRLLAVDSLELNLLSEGRTKASPSSDIAPDIVIQSPAMHSRVSGGVVQVSGTIAAGVELPLRVQLVDADGKVVGQRLAGGKLQNGREITVFSADVSYLVSKPTAVRLLVFEEGKDLRQVLAASSLELVIYP